jgi:hypothetical protein
MEIRNFFQRRSLSVTVSNQIGALARTDPCNFAGSMERNQRINGVREIRRAGRPDFTPFGESTKYRVAIVDILAEAYRLLEQV